MIRKFNLRLGWFLLLGSTAFWWLLLANNPQGATPAPLHIAALRHLAAQMPGTAPYAVEYEDAATNRVLGDYIVAGGGLKKRALSVAVFRLPVAGGKALMIDSGPSPSASADRAYAARPTAVNHVKTALAEAGRIILTEGSALHVTALLALAELPGQAQLLDRVCLTPRQRVELATLPVRFRSPLPLPAACLSGTGPEAVAPGVVAIPAPGHSPASQMIYVRLANGREYLFAGQNAPLDASWRQLRARARLIGDFRYGENRREVFSWLLTIRQLAKEAPGLVIVPGSDREWMDSAADNHLLTQGFTPDQP